MDNTRPGTPLKTTVAKMAASITCLYLDDSLTPDELAEAAEEQRVIQEARTFAAFLQRTGAPAHWTEDKPPAPSWTDASALWQVMHGERDALRTRLAAGYIESRLDDYSATEANAMPGEYTS